MLESQHLKSMFNKCANFKRLKKFHIVCQLKWIQHIIEATFMLVGPVGDSLPTLWQCKKLCLEKNLHCFNMFSKHKNIHYKL
jgi:hypothetical protein